MLDGEMEEKRFFAEVKEILKRKMEDASTCPVPKGKVEEDRPAVVAAFDTMIKIIEGAAAMKQSGDIPLAIVAVIDILANSPNGVVRRNSQFLMSTIRGIYQGTWPQDMAAAAEKVHKNLGPAGNA